MASTSIKLKPLTHKAQAGGRRKGLKPGQTHSGSFRKGFDPRRNLLGGWKNHMAIKQIEAIAVQHAEDAIKVFTDVIGDKNASDRDRMSAAKEMLDRGFGRPVDRLAIKNMGASGGKSGLEDQSTESILQSFRENVELRAVAGGTPSQVIDLIPDSDGD